MDMSENEMIENNNLEYRPHFEESKRERTAWDSTNTDDLSTPVGQKEKDVGDGLFTEIIEHTFAIGEKLKERLSELEEKFKKKEVAVSHTYIEDVNRAKEELGLKDGPFTFSDYIEAFDKRDTPAGDFLVEVAERYFEGPEGEIDLELYQDYKELTEEQSILEMYIKRVSDRVYGEIDWNLPKEARSQKVLEKEKDWGVKKDVVTLEKRSVDNMYKEVFLKNPENLTQAQAVRYQTEPKYDQLKDEESQLREVMQISWAKTYEFEKLLKQADTLVEGSLFETDKKSIEHALSSVSEEKEWNTGLTQTALMLTLAIERKNNEKHHLKHTLRNTYAPKKQTRILDEWNIYQNLYTKDTLPLLHTLRAYNEEQDEATTNFLSHVTQAMSAISEEKESRIQDWQRVQEATSMIRSEKISRVTEKEEAREGYRLIQALIAANN